MILEGSFVAVEHGSRAFGLTISAVKVHFKDDKMWVELSDGRSLGVPLSWFPRLAGRGDQTRKPDRAA